MDVTPISELRERNPKWVLHPEPFPDLGDDYVSPDWRAWFFNFKDFYGLNWKQLGWFLGVGEHSVKNWIYGKQRMPARRLLDFRQNYHKYELFLAWNPGNLGDQEKLFDFVMRVVKGHHKNRVFYRTFVHVESEFPANYESPDLLTRQSPHRVLGLRSDQENKTEAELNPYGKGPWPNNRHYRLQIMEAEYLSSPLYCELDFAFAENWMFHALRAYDPHWDPNNDNYYNYMMEIKFEWWKKFYRYVPYWRDFRILIRSWNKVAMLARMMKQDGENIPATMFFEKVVEDCKTREWPEKVIFPYDEALELLTNSGRYELRDFEPEVDYP